MNPSIDLTARETEIIRVIKTLTQETHGFVLIGGYAVNALGQHRFSVDCDLATEQQHLSGLERSLQREGFRATGRSRPPTLRAFLMKRYSKRMGREPVSVELYVNRVVSRQTGGAWSYRLITAHAVEAIVAGVTDSTLTRIPARELLAAMKLHSGRGQDLADLVMLSEGMDWNDMARFSACGSREKVNKQLETALVKIGTGKFEADLKSAFALRAEVERLIKRAVKGLEKLKNQLPNTGFNPLL